MRWSILPLVCLPTLSAQVAPLTEEAAAEVRTAVLPADDELAWLEIPWRPTLWSAMQEARSSGRPVLLWAMNGHPLGCT